MLKQIWELLPNANDLTNLAKSHSLDFSDEIPKFSLNPLQVAIRQYPASVPPLALSTNILHLGEHGFDAIDEAAHRDDANMFQFLILRVPRRRRCDTLFMKLAIERHNLSIFELGIQNGYEEWFRGVDGVKIAISSSFKPALRHIFAYESVSTNARIDILLLADFAIIKELFEEFPRQIAGVKTFVLERLMKGKDLIRMRYFVRIGIIDIRKNYCYDHFTRTFIQAMSVPMMPPKPSLCRPSLQELDFMDVVGHLYHTNIKFCLSTKLLILHALLDVVLKELLKPHLSVFFVIIMEMADLDVKDVFRDYDL
jgi:hypothetical protein